MQNVNNVRINGWSCSPKHDPAHFTVLKHFPVWMVWSSSEILNSMAGLCFPKHGPVPFTVLKNFFVWMFCSNLKPFKFMAGPRSPTSPFTAQVFSRRWGILFFRCYADCQQRSNQRLVVLPQTRSSSFHGVEAWWHDGMKLFSNDRIYGLAVLPQTRPSSFHDSENLFVWMLCTRLKPFKFMAGPRSPTSPVMDQLISRWERCVSFWWFADFQQRLNEWLVVLPQTRSSSFHGVKAFCRLDGMKVFKIIQSDGWAVLLQTRPSSFHSLEKFFRPDVMQPVKTIQVYGWAALPNIPCHGPAKFAKLNNFLVVMLCKLSTTFKSTAGRAPPNTIQLISRC